jgi:hypothetical protein
LAIQEDAPCGLENPIGKQRIAEQKGNKIRRSKTTMLVTAKTGKDQKQTRPRLNPKLKQSPQTEVGVDGEKERKKNRLRQKGGREKRAGMEKAMREE